MKRIASTNIAVLSQGRKPLEHRLEIDVLFDPVPVAAFTSPDMTPDALRADLTEAIAQGQRAIMESLQLMAHAVAGLALLPQAAEGSPLPPLPIPMLSEVAVYTALYDKLLGLPEASGTERTFAQADADTAAGRCPNGCGPLLDGHCLKCRYSRDTKESYG